MQPNAQGIGADSHHLLPALNLLSLCVELTLKAYIVHQDNSFGEAQLKALGHNLVKAFGHAAWNRLATREPVVQASLADITYLNDRYQNHAVRYPRLPMSFSGEFSRLATAKSLLTIVAKELGMTGLRVQSDDSVIVPDATMQVRNVATSGVRIPPVIPRMSGRGTGGGGA